MHAPARADLSVSQPDHVDRGTLAFLRLIAARSRCLGRADVHEACATLSLYPQQEADALALTLFQAMSGHDGAARLRLYEPGAVELSFDERWLLSALDAASRADIDSLAFLLARRLPPHARRTVGVLVKTLAKTVQGTATSSAA